MKKFRCKKTFRALKFGFDYMPTFEYGSAVIKGEIFEFDPEDMDRAYSNSDKTDRLISHDGYWIEIAKRKLSKYFEEVVDAELAKRILAE